LRTIADGDGRSERGLGAGVAVRAPTWRPGIPVVMCAKRPRAERARAGQAVRWTTIELREATPLSRAGSLRRNSALGWPVRRRSTHADGASFASAGLAVGPCAVAGPPNWRMICPKDCVRPGQNSSSASSGSIAEPSAASRPENEGHASRGWSPWAGRSTRCRTPCYLPASGSWAP
jgi:hypothetical protein